MWHRDALWEVVLLIDCVVEGAYANPMDRLYLQFEPEDEWHGKLFATVAADGFAGSGSAWLSTSDIREFAAAASAYPLPAECSPILSGGLGGNATQRPQTTMLIRLDQHDALGAVRVTVQLATEIWNSQERDLARSLTARFLVTYGDLGRFGTALSDLLAGRTSEAVLMSTPS